VKHSVVFLSNLNWPIIKLRSCLLAHVQEDREIKILTSKDFFHLWLIYFPFHFSLFSSRCQFHQRFTRTFFVQKFVQSQNVTRKKAFVRKISAFNVDEIDNRMFLFPELIKSCVNLFWTLRKIRIQYWCYKLA